jgi:hypothetical protein
VWDSTNVAKQPLIMYQGIEPYDQMGGEDKFYVTDDCRVIGTVQLYPAIRLDRTTRIISQITNKQL